MKRRWLYYGSPFMLAAPFGLIPFIMLIGMHDPGLASWGALFLVVFIPGTIVLLVLDIVVKLLTGDNILYIWIAELIMIIIALVWMRVSL